MTEELTMLAILTLKSFQQDVETVMLPPSEIVLFSDHAVLPPALFKRCKRGYILKVVSQINRTYSETCYDACSVMIRRLIETLIIEVYEVHGIDGKIKDANGDFKYLSNLIDEIVKETKWNLSRNCRKGLGNLKSIGDLSAHNRRYNAHREDIDKAKQDLRVVAQELLTLAQMY